jgi:hypothetical protein
MGAAMADAEGEGSIGKALATWGTIAALAGLASDILQPLGPIAFIGLVALAAGAVLFFLLSLVTRNRGLRQTAFVCLIGAAVFAFTVGLQQTASGGKETGFVAAIAPPVASVQKSILGEAAPLAPAPAVISVAPAPVAAPVAAPPATLGAIDSVLATQDPSARMIAAQAVLSDPDAQLRAAAAMRFYDSGDATLRRQAIIAMLANRAGGAGFAVNVVEAADNDEALVKVMGAPLYITKVDAATGGVGGSYYSSAMTGSVAMSAVNFSAGNNVLELKAEDGYVLRGMLRSRGYGKAHVEIPLM